MTPINIAISSDSLGYSSRDALTRAADLGFKLVEINLQTHEFGYGYQRRPDVAFYKGLVELVQQLGLSVWSVTAPSLTQRQLYSRRARKEILLNAVGAAGLLGARVFVVEPAHIFSGEQAYADYVNGEGAPPVYPGFDELWAQAVNRRMNVALRNCQYFVGHPLTNNAERMQKTTQDLGIGWAADLRLAGGRGGIERWLDKVGERLAVAYAYDVAEDGDTRLTCEDPDWQQWLPPLGGQRLKTLVLCGHPNQDDEEFGNCRRYIEATLGSGQASEQV